MKLSQLEMNESINRAWKIHAKYSQANFRFSQALWAELPTKTSQLIYQTDKDFYYWSDERVAEILEIVHSYLVEQ